MPVLPSGPPRPQTNRRDRFPFIGFLCVVAAFAVFGVQHLVSGRFLTRLTTASGPLAAEQGLLPRLAGLLLLFAVLLLALPVSRRRAALVLGFLVLASFLFLHLPVLFVAAPWGAEWTNAFKALALSGACLGIAAWNQEPRGFGPAVVAAAGEGPSSGTADSGRLRDPLGWVSRIFLSAFLLLAGIQHFIWAPFVASLVPSWIPGAHAWTYVTGVALIAGAAGLLLPASRRAAGLAIGGMVLAWVVLLHVPRVSSDLGNANEITSLAEALAFSGTAWLLSGRRGKSTV